MPNHIKNRITIKGTPEQVKEVVERFSTHHPAEIRRAYDDRIICKKKGKETWDNVGWLDEKTNIFSRREMADVEGLPEDWEYDYSTPYDQFPDFNKVIPQPENIFNGNLGAAEEEMCLREGRPTWYKWNNENWGTKWNSYDHHQEGDNVFTFETAWSGVPNIIETISKVFPEVEFEYEFADEDTGSSNCAIGVVKDGDWLSVIEAESGSKEAYEIAFKLRPHYRSDFKEVDGVYEYVEEDEDEE